MAPSAFMPCRGEESAPTFDASHPRTLRRYFAELEYLFNTFEVSDDQQKKRHAVRYIDDFDTADLWEVLSQFNDTSATYQDWKEAVFEFYPEAKDINQHSFSDLEALISKYSHPRITSLLQFAEYYRQFLLISTSLLKCDIISNLEQRRMFIQAFDPHLWSLIELRLHIVLVDHDPLRPYPIDRVFDAAQYVFKCQSANPIPSIVSTSPSNLVVSPSNLVVSPSNLVSNLIASPSNLVTSPSHFVPSPLNVTAVTSSPSTSSSNTFALPQTSTSNFESIARTVIEAFQDLRSEPIATFPSISSPPPSLNTSKPRTFDQEYQDLVADIPASENHPGVTPSSSVPAPRTSNINLTPPNSSIEPSPPSIVTLPPSFEPRTSSPISSSPSSKISSPLPPRTSPSSRTSSSSSLPTSPSSPTLSSSSSISSSSSHQLRPSSPSSIVTRPLVSPLSPSSIRLRPSNKSSNPSLPSGYAPPSDRNFASVDPKPKRPRTKPPDPPDPPDTSSKRDLNVEPSVEPTYTLFANPSISVTRDELLSLSDCVKKYCYSVPKLPWIRAL